MLMDVQILSNCDLQITYSLLLFNALGDHGLVLAIQCLHKQIVFPCPLQLRSIDNLQTPPSLKGEAEDSTQHA